jgi:transposase
MVDAGMDAQISCMEAHMAAPLVDDTLWTLVEPLLPPPRPRRFRYPGRKPITHRQALAGILFVLFSGIPWERLPMEMGCGSGVSCWRRLRDWQEQGVWERLFEVVLSELRRRDRLDLSIAAVDSSSVRSVGAGSDPRRKRARIRRIALVRARSTISSQIDAARRCPA